MKQTISIIIPHLGESEYRVKGLQACIDSIKNVNYPQELISIHVIDGPETVPKKVKKGVSLSDSEFIVYAANDMTFDVNCLAIAVIDSDLQGYSLVSFNEGELLPDKGNICTHFLIRRDFLPYLEKGEIFSTDFYHCGSDNWLWAQADKLGEAYWSEAAKITHTHFSKGGALDEVYQKGWSHNEEDRETLKKKLATL